MSDFDNTGKASAWRGKGGKAPALKVKCYAHKDLAAGTEFEVSLWTNESDNPKAPILKGEVQDPWKPPQDNMHRGAQPGQTASDFNDDIPF